MTPLSPRLVAVEATGGFEMTMAPPGVGAARNPLEFLKPGDVMETEISEIGVIRNTIQAVPA